MDDDPKDYGAGQRDQPHKPPRAGQGESGPPIPAVMHCPFCGLRHVDEGEWETRPHHKHLCLGCKKLWRVEPYVYGVPPHAGQGERRALERLRDWAAKFLRDIPEAEGVGDFRGMRIMAQSTVDMVNAEIAALPAEPPRENAELLAAALKLARGTIGSMKVAGIDQIAFPSLLATLDAAIKSAESRGDSGGRR